MPHDGATPTPVLNGTAKKGLRTTSPELDVFSLDFSKPLVWDATSDWATQFNALIKSPPLHSVVIEIAPEVAGQLLKLSNTKNRPKQSTHASHIGSVIAGDEYEMTGDTVKFSRTGKLLDGQHRLDGCIKAKTPLLTHVVFGLADDVFDVLDQGKKRTPGDILALCGIPEPVMAAGAIAWVKRLEAGTEGGGTFTRRELTPRKIRALALGPMKDIANYVKDARLVNVAYKHPPTMICGLLYLIGKYNAGVARDFAHEWVHGAKIGRNKNFDVLQQRINQIAHGNNGVVSRTVRAALLIQTFNHWHAHVVASPRALTWRKGWAFPTLEFNTERFKQGKSVAAREDTSLPAVKHRVHYVMTKMQDKKGFVSLPHEEIAKLANVSRGSVGYILGELCRGKQLSPVRGGKKGAPTTFQVIVPAVEVSKVEA